MTKYHLKTIATGREFDDTGWVLDDPQYEGHSLVRAIYDKKQLTLGDPTEGIYKFADWMPISRTLKGSAAPVTYKSKGLAEKLGLTNLWITFNGYYPEIGANMSTCSFKETESYTVGGRISANEDRVLVVASAGNTARAFAKVCSENNIKLLLSVPEDNLDALWFEKELNPCVKLIASRTGSDYFDAIHLGNIAVKSPKFYAEGGAKNVARRDGMATTTLSAVTTIGQIPDYYFQAVGSGTGAIAAWEANLRFIEDGRFGDNKMKLIVSQNHPFVPMYDAWKANSREMLPYEDNEARRHVEIIDAKVLSNRKPPYAIIGGLYDALVDCDGDVVIVDNEKAREAAAIYQKLEGIDIHPAAAVAVASLIDAVNAGRVNSDDCIMLNITGGGEGRLRKELGDKIFYLKPTVVFDVDPCEDSVLKAVEQLF